MLLWRSAEGCGGWELLIKSEMSTVDREGGRVQMRASDEIHDLRLA